MSLLAVIVNKKIPKLVPSVGRLLKRIIASAKTENTKKKIKKEDENVFLRRIKKFCALLKMCEI